MSAIPRTSIIMPVYNTASTVIAAIKSVLAQTDPNFELLVMIDGSPDHSAQLIADYLQQNPDERVRVFNNPKNQGLSAMRNQGLDEARGEWVTFPDSDDALYPTFLERLHYHAERTGAQVVNCAHNQRLLRVIQVRNNPGNRQRLLTGKQMIRARTLQRLLKILQQAASLRQGSNTAPRQASRAHRVRVQRLVNDGHALCSQVAVQ